MVSDKDRKDIESCALFQSTLHHPEQRVYLVCCPHLYFQLTEDGQTFRFCREVRKREKVEREGVAPNLESMLDTVREFPEYQKHLKASRKSVESQLEMLREKLLSLESMLEVLG